MASTWDRFGPRQDERVLAGKVAGMLSLTIIPMLSVDLLLPGSETNHWRVLILITLPAAAWGIACLLLPWDRVGSPLVFHGPATLALPYIALLIGFTGVVSSPFGPTLWMLIAFCAYFFAPRMAILYIIAALAVRALPLAYDRHAVEDGLLGQMWIATFVFAAVGAVIMIGKRQLLALRDAAYELSLRDSLTGLANRRGLQKLLEDYATYDGDARIGLVLVDLDDFKEANTLYGLPGGDRVLCVVSEALTKIARGDDMVARLGGDEFAIVVSDVDKRVVQRLAERAVESVRAAGAELGLSGFEFTASAGWALYPEDTNTVEGLFAVADLSLRSAKLNGKDRTEPPVNWSRASAARR